MKKIIAMLTIAVALIGVGLNAQLGNLSDAAKKEAEKKAKEEAARQAENLKNQAQEAAYRQFKNVAQDIPFKEHSHELNLNDPNYKIAGVSVDEFMKKTLIPALAQLVETLPVDKKVHIIGHANKTGTEEASPGFEGNIALSRRRAQAVLNYLMRNSKLSASKFKIIGKGSSELIASETDEKNCRVSFDIGGN